MIEKFWYWLRFYNKFAKQNEGLPNHYKSYSKERRWWLLQIDKIIEWKRREKSIPDWLMPPAGAGRTAVYTECFDRVNLHTDIPRLYNRLEAQGAFEKNPDYRKSMDIKMEALKRRPAEIIDYQKTGHPARDF